MTTIVIDFGYSLFIKIFIIILLKFNSYILTHIGIVYTE